MTKIIILVSVVGALVGMNIAIEANFIPKIELANDFNGKKAMQDVVFQVEFGPRIPGSPAHTQVRDWMVKELVSAGWKVEIQQAEMMGHPVYNVIAKWGEGHPWIILGAHYDSRLSANKDPLAENWSKPVPGANDGASGVATLLEIGRVLPHYFNQEISKPDGGFKQVWLVFFDSEDNGNIPGWDWVLGSRAFVQTLDEHPDAAVIIDMIGDRNLKIYGEKNSDATITDEIWDVAASIGYSEYFSKAMKYRILDDHVPFLEAGIPAIDIIDIEYLYYHTTSDTTDKVSAQSMKIVGETLLHWLTSYKIDYANP